MAIVLLNGDVTGAAYQASTWGELLDALDEESVVHGDVVTGVRVDGVDIPAFRTPQALSQALETNAEVCIETAHPAALIHQTLDEAEAATHAIIEAATALAGSYRAKAAAAANESLPEFARSLGALVEITSVLAQHVGVDLSAIGCDGATAMQMINSLLTRADVLLAAQRTGDWTQMADVIDHDVVPAVRQWPRVLNAIREAAPALADLA